MKRMILPVLVVSLLGITAAGAYPVPRAAQTTSNDLVLDVGHKGGKYNGKGHRHHGHNKYHGNYKYGGKYRYGSRNWTYRYRYRPIGWAAWGCIAAGPFWYCP